MIRPGIELGHPEDSIPPTVKIAGIAGLIPFVALAIAAWTPASPISLPVIFHAGLAYGAIVLSFMGGMRWRNSLTQASRELALCFLPPLAGWIALLLAPLLGLCLLVAGFLLQALWNVLSADRGELPRWFGNFSSQFIAGAVIMLLAMLVRLLT